MIFSADLDHTLIFTPRKLVGDAGVIPAEYRQGEPFSFMTPAALEALRCIQQNAICLVNTLRGLEQANRVIFVADGSCRYLSLQNGLYLYRDGSLDADWSAHVARTVGGLPLGLADGVSQVLGQLPGIECLSKQYEYLAVFFVDEGAFDDAACAGLASDLAARGWELYRQRKKLYLSPLQINKGAVLGRVRELEAGMEASGFGDSYFDLPMLAACQKAYSLKNSELDGWPAGFPIRFSRFPAQSGSQEILRHIAIEQSRSGTM